MNLYSVINIGVVKLNHHSTASVVEIVINDNDDGDKKTLWLDYNQVSDLKKVLDKFVAGIN